MRWVVVCVLWPAVCFGQSALPDPALTPGAVDSRVTQDVIASTICVRGYTATVRPSFEAGMAMKRRVMRLYGYGGSMHDFVLDHLIPLELGGAAADVRNLWPEPRFPEDGPTDLEKDRLENRLHHLVCSGAVSLSEARAAFTGDWRAAFEHYRK